MVLPELALTGYPPLDLLERDGFVRDQLRELDALAAASRDIAIAVGAVLPTERRGGKQLMNAAVLLAGRRARRARRRRRTSPPTTCSTRSATSRRPRSAASRASARGRSASPCARTRWVDAIGYAVDPVGELAQAGAELVLNLSASPCHVGKAAFRRAHCWPTSRRSTPYRSRS